MIAILTGDIINSQAGQPSDWLLKLKKVLNHYGTSPKQWEIYRGDSFQLSVAPKVALLAALHIKAAIKQTKNQDVRIALGIGQETHHAQNITESNGSAYVHSGEAFENMKKQTLVIQSEDPHWNDTLNLMLTLALLTANQWSSTVAKIITTVIEHPTKNQKDIAKLLNKSQSTISEALKRGGYEEVMNLNRYYTQQLDTL
ncbi:transcriptional regulator [Reichenbachiella sp. 5M10]|uniref:helix-turn-helix domain-containing protein n=1 Tax=Reichenbachiella sp. 5M10 TaxID=1889772 RepID=UPI000C155E20|nr:helix-turn-helix domain-containing protein [Reichenbachiella sp. 5M10]PIB34857.1 transcriptional regulator [Reichenbachiella sp. 5M10]